MTDFGAGGITVGSPSPGLQFTMTLQSLSAGASTLVARRREGGGGESVRLATSPLDLIVQRWSVAGLIDKPDGSKDSRMKEEALGAVFFLLVCVCVNCL